MIQANELRIGNWVYQYGEDWVTDEGGNEYPVIDRREYSSNGTYVQITIENFIEIANDFNNEYTGLKLNEIILKNAGFDKINNLYVGFELLWSPEDGIMLDLRHRVRIKHVKYLHQLQNLYFALTGTELDIAF